jgi:hypothetical protein
MSHLDVQKVGLKGWFVEKVSDTEVLHQVVSKLLQMGDMKLITVCCNT